MKNFFGWLKNEESGQGMVEYGLIIALVAIIVIAGLTVLGPSIKKIFSDASVKLGGESASSGT